MECLRTLFSALEGVTHEGSFSAASMSKNSPSESKMLRILVSADHSKNLNIAHLITKFHLLLSSLKSQTVHHSSSMQSPMRIRPSRTQMSALSSGSGATLSSNASRCHRCPLIKDCTCSKRSAARAVAETRSDCSNGK